MTSGTLATVAAFGIVLASPSPAPAQVGCSAEPLALQVLGSGGPYASTRSSSGYLIWMNGRAVVMVDAGGGTMLRFGESGAQLQDLSLLAISHVHPDHVADLPALLWLSEQSRRLPLRVAGPSGAGAFPSFDSLLRRLFDGGAGAFPALAGTLGQQGQGVRLDVLTVDATVGTQSTVLSDDNLEVRALGVPHGNTPSLAYRIRIGNRTVVLGSDQTGADPRFGSFAADADVLVMHFALSQRAGDPVVQIHAKPDAVGRAAQNAKAKRLVLSHLMKASPSSNTADWLSLFDLDGAVAEVRKSFSGPVDTASDLQCFPIR